MARRSTALGLVAKPKGQPNEWAPRPQISDEEGFLIFEVTLTGASLQKLELDVEGRAVTLRGRRVDDQVHHAVGSGLTPFELRFSLPKGFDLRRALAAYNDQRLDLRIPKAGLPSDAVTWETMVELFLRTAQSIGQERPVEYDPKTTRTFPIDFVVSALPDSQPRETAIGVAVALEDDRILTKGNVRYYPLPLAAKVAQAPRTTLLDWYRNKTKFQGRVLEGYNSPSADKFYISEDSVNRVARRFVRWPSTEPAGFVTIGKTTDQTGFVSLPEGARLLDVSKRTMWLWASQGKAPSEKALDVIKCTASDHFYIREKDVLDLKQLIPKSGLKRGRRPRQILIRPNSAAPHP